MEIKTDEKLLQALKRAAGHKPTAAELKEQRVSFIFGSMKNSSNVTRSRIAELLKEHDGVAAQ